MSIHNRNTSSQRLNAGILAALSIFSIPAAQAATATVSGTIYQLTNPNATTIDYWAINLSAEAIIEIDVRANEGFLTSLPGPPGAYSDLNGDGEITLADTQFRIYQDTVSAATEVATADDSAAYTTGLGDGWADGTLNSRDSYGQWQLGAGSYIMAFGDYQLTTADAIGGLNTGDTLGSNQTHTDYQITITADVPFTVSPVTAVPIPAAVWLFGSALTGFGLFGRKQKA